MAEVPGRRRRRAWRGPSSAHIEVRAAHKPGFESLAKHLETELQRLKGVDWAEVNSLTGRVVVVLDEAFEGEPPDLDELVEVVEDAEELHGVSEEGFPHDRPEFPADPEPLHRNLVALGADAVGTVAGTVGLFTMFLPIPGEFGALVSVAQNERHVRDFLHRRFGTTTTELSLALASSVIQAVSGGPLNQVADAAHRVSLIREIRARRALWEEREKHLSHRHRGASVEAVAHHRRPTPLPRGPIEKYSDRVALGSMAAFVASLVVTRDPLRSVSALTAGLPKAARLGRDAFAAQLTCELSSRGVLVMDTAMLRRLDRVDAVVLDVEAIADHNGDLFPISPYLLSCAREGGHHVVVAGEVRSGRAHVADERIMPGGNRLAETVTDLQDEGRAVLLVTTNRHHQAMSMADCCVALLGDEGHVPFAADLIAGDLEDVWLVLHSTAAARQLSRLCTLVTGAGSGIGSVWAIMGPGLSAARRTALPVDLSALTTQAMGTVAAHRAARRRPPMPPEAVPWHEMESSRVLDRLDATAHGLDAAEAQRRSGAGGAPVPIAPVTRLARSIGRELANPLTPILGVGVGLSAVVGSVVDAALVGGVMAVNATVSGIQRFRTETSLDRLVKLSVAPVTVRRGGSGDVLETSEVEPARLVAGDVVELSAGDIVPADCRILDAEGCEVDESSLTGESLPVAKQAMPTPGMPVAERSCMLFEGCTVVNGMALGVVVATGRETEAGRALEAAPEPPESGVEARLRTLTAVTAPATIASGAAVAGLSLLRSGNLPAAISSGVSLTVAAVPEGLPLLANLAQLSAARRLSQHQALVRNPRTIEALGRVDVLCFDKTGTLTAGTIALQRISDGHVDEPISSLPPHHRAVLAAALRASPWSEEDDDPLPHATDRAVIEGGADAGVSADEGVGSWVPLAELAFEPARGFHAVAGRTTNGNGPLVAVKGAPEVVLPKCVAWRNGSGVRPMGPRTRRRLEAEAERLAARGLRVLAVAERRLTDEDAVGHPAFRNGGRRHGGGRQSGGNGTVAHNGDEGGLEDDHLSDMELVGFLGMADRVRPTASRAIDKLRRAGVDMVMITGDHPTTAESVATDIGLINGKCVMTGPEIDELSDAQLAGALGTVSVFARVTPAHKVRIVRAFQDAGHVVAMTGDGANDAAALRLAHTGIALGKRGSQAAVEAADVVVIDDRIETIIDAIIEGRAMWASVRDALAILVGGNMGEVGFTVAATAIGGTSPLGARQFLLVNLLTDMLPALTIALRPPPARSPESLLHEGPEASLGGSLTRQIMVRALATGGGATGAWLVARPTGTARRASTVALAALVGTQLAQTAVVGYRSPLVLASVGASAVALAGVVQTPGVSQFFGCTPMGPVGWGIALGATAAATAGSVVVPRILRF